MKHREQPSLAKHGDKAEMLFSMRKIRTAKQVFQARGVKGIALVLFKEKLMHQWYMFIRWLREGNWWVGKLVEIKGNVVSIDGCEFSVRSPAISTAFKSYFFFDCYELAEREALNHYLDPCLPVVELGGAMGVISCLTNRRLHDPLKHVVVEANPEILPLLKDNRDRNGCQFTILPGAVAYGADEIAFHISEEFWTSSVQAPFDKSVNVPTLRLEQIVNEFGFQKFTLICDIEGGEVDLVKFDEDVLREQVVSLIIEVHEDIAGAVSIRNMLLRLEEMGFKSVHKHHAVYVLQKQS
jgi:FkbM family methyltransferase